MEAVIEFIFAGMRKFAGEIIGAVMVTVLLWLFPGFRKFFRYKNANDAEILRQENEKLSKKRRKTPSFSYGDISRYCNFA